MTSFSTATSANVVFSPQNPLTFSINSAATLLYNFKTIPRPKSKIIELETTASLKKLWSSPYNIEVMITSLIEMLVLLNVGHMTTSTT